MEIIRTVTLMDKTIEQVKQLAHRCGVPKLILFGSRARGDHHARSDYDFAIWGCTPQQRAQFSDAVENDLDSLYSVDLVFVSEHTDAALLTMPNIQQTKITEILNNIAMSCRMEGLEMTDEIRAMCLAIYNGSTTLQDCLHKINAKYL